MAGWGQARQAFDSKAKQKGAKTPHQCTQYFSPSESSTSCSVELPYSRMRAPAHGAKLMLRRDSGCQFLFGSTITDHEVMLPTKTRNLANEA